MSTAASTAPIQLQPGTAPRVVVVGGGLAGMAAAVALESAGAAVTLLEATHRLGGRASSFRDPRSGEELDNGQHILLGCCTNLIDFYRRLGASELIQYESAVHFRDQRGSHDLHATRALPAPAHLGLSALGFGALSIRQRFAAIRGMLAMLRLGRSGARQLADMPFGQWLEEHRQPAALLRTLYGPIITGALNEDPLRASASYALQVFQDAVLTNRVGYRLGLPTCPLGRLYQNLPCRDLRTSARVVELRFDGSTLAAVELATGEIVPADAFVLAAGHQALRRWLPPELLARDSRFANLGKFEAVPILAAHMWFDRGIMAETHAALLDGPLQWLFRKDRAGRVVVGVISAAREWLRRPRHQSLELFADQIRRLFPAAREAKLDRGLVIIETRATFAPSPGIDAIRPPQGPPENGIENLYLAGDYTQTRWPSTMEGAVRSGYLAAEAVASRLPAGSLTSTRFLVDDLPVQWPARALGYRR